MDKNKLIKRTLSGVLVGGMLLSGGIAFADDTTADAAKRFIGRFKAGHMGGPRGGYDKGRPEVGFNGNHGPGFFGQSGRGQGIDFSQETLAELVREGILTQEKADAVKGYMDKLAEEQASKAEERKSQIKALKKLTPEERKAQREERGEEKVKDEKKGDFKGRKDIFTDLVENNILTQDEADAVKVYLKTKAETEAKQKFTDTLKDLLSQGTITQDQLEKIIVEYEALQKGQEAKHEERKAEMEKLKDMTKEERDAYFKENKDRAEKPADFESRLVEAGIITQEQADAIKEKMKSFKQVREEQQANMEKF